MNLPIHGSRSSELRSLTPGVPREMHFDSLGQETLTAALTASGECGAAAFGAHARAETVLLFPGSLGSL